MNICFFKVCFHWRKKLHASLLTGLLCTSQSALLPFPMMWKLLKSIHKWLRNHQEERGVMFDIFLFSLQVTFAISKCRKLWKFLTCDLVGNVFYSIFISVCDAGAMWCSTSLIAHKKWLSLKTPVMSANQQSLKSSSRYVNFSCLKDYC